MTKHYKGKLLSPPNINIKAMKNLALKVHTYFLSLAPSDTSGFNVCAMANRVSIKEKDPNKSNCSYVCVAHNGNGRFEVVEKARIRKTRKFFLDRENFLIELVQDIFKAIEYSNFYGFEPTFRLNAYSDLPFERIKIKAFGNCTIQELFPDVTFYDYSKVPNRKTPNNYELTYSHFGKWEITNDQIKKGYNVAMVFNTNNDKKAKLPATYNNLKVIDGDKTDLRTSKNDGINTIVGLRAKMSKAKIQEELKQKTSFVVNP